MLNPRKWAYDPGRVAREVAMGTPLTPMQKAERGIEWLRQSIRLQLEPARDAKALPRQEIPDEVYR